MPDSTLIRKFDIWSHVMIDPYDSACNHIFALSLSENKNNQTCSCSGVMLEIVEYRKVIEILEYDCWNSLSHVHKNMVTH